MRSEALCAATGVFGSLLASLFGGFDAAMTTLLIFMAVDYLSGLIVAGVFQNSNKSKNGTLESRAGWKGLCRKGMSLLIVLVAVRLDLALGTNYIRDGVCITFITNETISIVENAGLMGVPIPKKLTRAIEVLKEKEEIEEMSETGDNAEIEESEENEDE